ncbi:MAG: J domain-containing protein [Lysobacteraceae bacterium]|nr:MAG: J domain-containing protein [Xanthomonadaceae bacterium]
MERDLSELYSELGLPPGCSLEELKRAYRRRIAKLHPDHGDTQDDAGAPIAELVKLYDSAIRFHRLHGRLPGATAGAGPGGNIAPRGTAAATRAGTPPALSVPAAAVRLPLAALLLPLVALLVLLLLSRDWLSPAVVPEPLAPQPSSLEAGMDEATVLAIQGRPVLVRDGRWHYGASWLQFERGRLVDWRSSPGYPLKTPAETPPPIALVDSAL